jgi:hypothetical protein
MMRRTVLLVLLAMSLILSRCGLGGPKTVVAITNKITSLPAGQTYPFNIDLQHDQMKGFTLVLTGQGTLVETGPTATYLAPPVPPSPNSVTVTVNAANGSGVSDSNTFTITAAAGPVVSISPTTFTVTAGGPPFTLNVSVTRDDPTDMLVGGASGSPACYGGVCGSFGPFSGIGGSGAYTVQCSPPSSVTMAHNRRLRPLPAYPTPPSERRL